MKEKTISKITATNDCPSKRDRKFLSHDLKNQLDVIFVSDKTAKGQRSIKTLVKIYLIEYENNKLSKPKLIRVFRIPVNDKISIESAEEINLFEFSIKLLNDIFFPKIVEPSSNIEPEIREFILRICSHKNNELLIQIAQITHFIIN